MNPYQRAVLRLGRTRLFAWLGPRLFDPIDRYARGHPIPATTLGTTLPLVYLTTTGRRSGDDRTIPLLGISTDETGTLVAGTNWGRHEDPGWVHNVRANPEAILDAGYGPIPVRAREVTGDEWNSQWARCTAVWPGYEQYRMRSGRDIALFVLEPLS